MRTKSRKKPNNLKIKRSGFVYKLYLKNILALWAVALVLFAGLMYIFLHNSGFNYLMNYFFYSSTPDPQALTEFTSRDMLDYEFVMDDIEANGGEMALMRQATSCFFRDNLYQENGRYRFKIQVDPDKLVDTGIYYDNMGIPYTDCTSRQEANALVPSENYLTEHLYFYEYEGMEYLFVLGDNVALEEEMRVTFAPMGVYSLHMVYDLYQEGYSGTICNYLIDARETPVDPEDEIFKDLCMYAPFALAFILAAILTTLFPTLHPTYRQLSKYGRTIQKAVEKVDGDYEEFGIESETKKTIFLNEWCVQKSTFKNGIEKNYKKQKN